MHELSLAQTLAEHVEHTRAAHGGGAIVSVTVRIGVLSGVDREAFERAFRLAVEGTRLKEIALTVRDRAAEVTCERCGQRSEPEDGILRCRCCRSDRVRITAGREFVIQSVERRPETAMAMSRAR